MNEAYGRDDPSVFFYSYERDRQQSRMNKMKMIREKSDLEVLADLVCAELSDDEEMRYPDRKGVLRELKLSVERLQFVLSSRDKKKLKNLSFN